MAIEDRFDEAIISLCKKAETVLKASIAYEKYGKDGNAWKFDVVKPALKWESWMYGKSLDDSLDCFRCLELMSVFYESVSSRVAADVLPLIKPSSENSQVMPSDLQRSTDSDKAGRLRSIPQLQAQRSPE